MEGTLDKIMSTNIPSSGDFKWTLNHIANGEDIINNNPPCIDIVEADQPTEPYVIYSK